MPFIPDEDFVNPGETLQINVPDPETPPSMWDVTKAAFRQENSLASALANGNSLTTVYEKQDGYDPFQFNGKTDIQGYEEYAPSFAGSNSESQTAAIKAQLDMELKDRDTLQAGGIPAIMAQMAAGVTDPVFLPLMLTPAGVGTKGVGFARSALEFGASAASGEIVAETAKHASQETRTFEDSLINVAGATLLSGIGGGLLSQVGSREFKSVSKAIDEDIHAQPGGEKLSFNGDESDLVQDGGSVGAAKRKHVEDEYLDIEGALGVEKLPVSPIIRTMTSPEVATKSIVQQMMETPVITKGEKAGIATAPEGGSVETRIKSYDYNLFQGMSSVKDNYLKYRQKSPTMMGDIAAKLETMTGQRGDKLSQSEFNEEIAKAMRRGDKHDIPEIQEAAEQIRREVFDPIKEKAIEEGLLDPDVAVKGSESYLTRMYNTEMIVQNRHQWNQILMDWLKRDAVEAAQKQGEILELKQAEGRSFTDISDEYFNSTDKAQRADLRKEMQVSARREGLTDMEPFFTKQTELDEMAEKIKGLRKQEKLTNVEVGKAKGADKLKEVSERLQDIKRDRIDLEKQHKRMKSDFAQVKKAREQDMSLTTRAMAGKDSPLEAVANNITDKILGNAGGRLDYDISPTVRGPLKERTLSISDELIEDFLVNDIEGIMHQYVRTMSADVEFKRMFGSVDMVDQIESIKKGYAKTRRSVTEPKKLKALEQRMAHDIRDVEAMRDRIRGTYMMPKDPNSAILRMGRFAMGWNFVRMLGGMTLSSIPDVGRVISRNGFGRTGKSIAMMTDFKRMNLFKADARKAGVALEMVLNSRAATLTDLTDIYARGNAFEKGLRVATDSFGKATLMTQWNDTLKVWSGVMSQDRFIADVLKWEAGTLSKTKKARLAHAGISEDMAGAIAEQFRLHGDTDNLHFPNYTKWDDDIAKDAFKMALLKDVDATVMTPGQGVKPLWTSTATGKLLFQFKTFAAEAHHKILLSDLQFRDASALTNLLIMTSLGTLSYAVKQHARGAEVETDPAKLVIEGLDNSGVMGYFWDANNTVEQLTRGTVGVSPLVGESTMSRYASRNWTGALLGPSLGTATELGVSLGAVTSGDVSESDVRSIRKLLPYQNLFYIRRLLDELEKPVAEAVAK